MKTIKVILFAFGLFAVTALQAQVTIRFNLGTPPQWGPAGYSDVHYYYLPDVEAYYDIESSMFIYQNAGRWVHRSSLPVRYRSYDLYHGYKVVMSDYHGNTPYTHFKDHKYKYAKGYRGQEQRSIGERPDHRTSRDYTPTRYRSHQKESQKGNGHNGGKGKKK